LGFNLPYYDSHDHKADNAHRISAQSMTPTQSAIGGPRAFASPSAMSGRSRVLRMATTPSMWRPTARPPV